METEIKKTKIDELGRVTLPTEWRKKVSTNSLYVIEYPTFLKLVPEEKKTDLREIFDRLKIDINAEDFKDYHRLKAKMLSGK